MAAPGANDHLARRISATELRARLFALLDGRAYVVPDDVKELAPAVLRHRVVVAPELELEGITADTALRGIIEKIEAPR